MPTLENNEASHEQKAEALKKAFFPDPPPADLTDIGQSTHTKEVESLPQITLRQVHAAINQLSPNKAPGPDEITNKVLKHALPVLDDHIRMLMQASINQSHYPTPFKKTTTVVLRKPGKPDYTKAKAYRPIALENTLGKVMESIVASCMSYLTETHKMLPTHHYGGRPGRSTEDAMMVLMESIHRAWKNKNVFTAVFLDVAGAFNNVHHLWLVHNLRTRGMPEAITKWVHSFLQGRSTQLLFNGKATESIPTPAGVPQGSPLSPLLYMYYNADLLDIENGPETTRLGFIDDITYGIAGSSDQENAQKLEEILRKTEIWRCKHGAQFETSKYTLIHFTRNPKHSTSATIKANGLTITPSREVKYLGVIFDQKLTFKPHVSYITKKGTEAAMALTRIAKCNWGAPYQYTRQLFNAVIAARTDYAACIWHRPNQHGKTRHSAQVQTLTTIQRTAMKAITGCFRTTSTAAMENESGLPPAWIRLQTKVLQSTTRMQTLAEDHPIQKWLQEARINRTSAATHRSNLENVMQQFPQTATKLEAIQPFIRPPWWVPKTRITIEQTKQEAKATHDRTLKQAKQETTTVLYTDGSGIQGRVGAAVVEPATKARHQKHLGNDTQYNVFAAETLALATAAKYLKSENTIIFTDSQAAIKAIDNPRNQSGQAIIKQYLDAIDQTRPSQSVHVVWIPGHEGIEGNEQADEAAKNAATGPSKRNHNHRPLKSATRAHIHKGANTQWQAIWNNETHTAAHLRKLAKRKGVKSGPKMYNGLRRADATILAQLRTRHCGLNHYLHKFKISNTPYCSCGYGKETVEHFLMECRKYKDHRKELERNVRATLGKRRPKMENLLGDPRISKHTAKFVRDTQRFTTT